MSNSSFLSNSQFWNPLDLAISPINKTISYEKLTLEEKVQKMENNLIDIQNNLSSDSENCKTLFKNAIQLHINNDENKYDYFDESPDYNENDSILKMMKTLAWLSYSDEIKKELLDNELKEYFS